MTSPATTTTLVIMGMGRNSAREEVAEALATLEGVFDVHVSLHRGTATIVHSPACTLGDLVAAVVRAGYGAALSHGQRSAPRARRP